MSPTDMRIRQKTSLNCITEVHMRRKIKIIVSVLFILLILTTAFACIYAITDSSESGEFEGIIALVNYFFALIAFAVVFLEVDLWHIAMYFLTDKGRKKTYKNVFNTAELIMILVLFIFILCPTLKDIISINQTLLKIVGIIGEPLIIIYALVKLVHLFFYSIKENT